MDRKYSVKPTMMDELKNCFRFLVSIFYLYNVVGKNTYLMYTKMGVRTSLFLTSQRMPSRYVAYRYIYNYKNIIK